MEPALTGVAAQSVSAASGAIHAVGAVGAVAAHAAAHAAAAVGAVVVTPAVAGAAVVGSAALYISSLELPPTLEGQLLGQIQKMEHKMKTAKTWEDQMFVDVEGVHELMSTLNQHLQAMSESQDLSDDLRQRLQKAMSKFGSLLHQVLSFGPKVRKLCLARQLGAKYLQKLHEVYTQTGQINRSLLEKAISKLIQDPASEQDMDLICKTTREIAQEFDSISQEIAAFAEQIKRKAKEIWDAAKQAKDSCSGGSLWDLFKAVLGICGIVIASCSALAGSSIGCVVSGLGGLLCCSSAWFSNRNRRRQSAQAEHEDEQARSDYKRVTERYNKLNQLRQKLSEAAEGLGEQQLSPCGTLIHHALVELGLKTHTYEQYAEDPEDLLPDLLSSTLGSELDGYIHKNKELVEKVRVMETALLNVSAKMMDGTKLPSVLPVFEPDVVGWMESPTECPTEPNTPSSSSSPWTVIEDNESASCSRSSSQGNGLSPA
jgi:gas vesicle protein